MRKLFAMLLVCVLMLNMSVSAFAVEVTEHVTDAETTTAAMVPGESDIVSPMASSAPTEQGTLPYTATVTNLPEGCGTYTKYYFKPSGTDLTISGTLSSCGDENNKDRKAVIYLYEVNGTSNPVDSYTVSQFVGSTTLSHTFTNLSTSKNYYIRIYNSTSWGVLVDKWIKGSVKIS